MVYDVTKQIYTIKYKMIQDHLDGEDVVVFTVDSSDTNYTGTSSRLVLIG